MENGNNQVTKEMKKEITSQMADLSRLLGEIPGDHQSIKDARKSFLKLGGLISRALDIDLY